MENWDWSRLYCINTVCPHSLSGRVILPILLKQNPVAHFHLASSSSEQIEQRLWAPNVAVGSVGPVGSLRLRLPTWSATVRQGQLATSDLRGINTWVHLYYRYPQNPPVVSPKHASSKEAIWSSEIRLMTFCSQNVTISIPRQSQSHTVSPNFNSESPQSNQIVSWNMISDWSNGPTPILSPKPAVRVSIPHTKSSHQTMQNEHNT